MTAKEAYNQLEAALDNMISILEEGAENSSIPETKRRLLINKTELYRFKLNTFTEKHHTKSQLDICTDIIDKNII